MISANDYLFLSIKRNASVECSYSTLFIIVLEFYAILKFHWFATIALKELPSIYKLWE